MPSCRRIAVYGSVRPLCAKGGQIGVEGCMVDGVVDGWIDG